MNFHTTGEVSKKLHISVRTLRYYDQIGLLIPSEKDEHGKRLYNESDLLTLEKITLLKSLNLSLKDIENILSEITIEQLLFAHKKSLELKVAEWTTSIKHTNTLLNIVKVEGDLKWDQLMSLVEQAQNKDITNTNWNEYFDQQEKNILQEKLPKMEEDGPSIQQWINLIRRIEIAIEKGVNPNSEEGQLIAEDTLILSDQLFDGNDELAMKFFDIRKSPDKSQEMNLYPVKEEVLAFLEEGMMLLQVQNQSDNKQVL